MLFSNSIARTQAEREYRAKTRGSPDFTYTPGAIDPAAIVEININKQFPGARKYEPLDSIEIINNEAANPVTVSINDRPAYADRTFPIPARTSRIVDDGVYIGTVHVRNDGAVATTAGNIVIRLKKKPYDANDAARRAL
ncbi:hypothetical protein [Dehalogenimonas formicexedens]|nr:hypothetical protein [Dehalogenimonas formicexedens]